MKRSHGLPRLFGVTEDEPVDFFIYADRDAFYEALGPGTRENVGGQANADIRTMFALIAPSSIDDPWVEIVVPHELIHLVFDTAVKNPYHFPPRWLNEGLAVYLSVGYEPGDRVAVDVAGRNGDLIPLDGLVGQFPTSASKFSLAYAESASAIDYLIRTHGEDAMVSLVRSYADGRTDDEAFEAAIGMDVAAFNEAWLADLGAKPAVKYGPQPPPAGPVPDDWSAASPAPGSSAPTRPGASRCAEHREPDRSAYGGVAAAGRAAARRPSRWRGHRAAGVDPLASPGWRAAVVIARIRSIPSWQVTLGAALLGLGFLIAAQLAAEGPRVRYTTQERSPLVETATQLQGRQDELKARILELRGRIQATEQADAGSAELVRELNDDLQDARIAAGLIPLTGTGIVLQVEDSAEPASGGIERGRLPGRRPGPARTGRGAVGGGRRGDRGQWRADHADHRDHRCRPVDPGQRRVPGRPVPDHRSRPGGSLSAAGRVARFRRPPPDQGAGVWHPCLDRRAGSGRHARVRRHGDAPVCPARDGELRRCVAVVPR